jgi:polyhydroxyalkanoate synthase subunit PhaC
VSPPTPGEALERLRREIDRAQFRARNGLKHLAGIDKATVGPTPREQVWGRDKIRLYRYLSSAGDAASDRAAPILLTMSLITRPVVFDLRPANSFVARLRDDGHDVFLLDWGVPDAVDSSNSLETYCDEYLPQAVAAALRVSGATELTLFGYCLGGVLSMLALAGNPELRVRSLVLLATPIDMAQLGPLASLVRNEALDLDTLLDETGNVPASTVLRGFRADQGHDLVALLDLPGDVMTYLNLWNSLANPEQLAEHQALVGWSGDHIPLPGAAFRQLVELFIRDDALLRGRVPLGGRVVDLHKVDLPVLAIDGERDELVPTAASAPLDEVLTGAQIDHLHLPGGHVGLIVGRRAHRDCIPAILSWLDRHSPRET